MRLLALSLLASSLISQQTVIKASLLYDGKGAILRNQAITVDGGKIVSIGPAGKAKPDYDLTGLHVMPGWIDTHVHLTWHFNENDRLEQGGAQETLYGEANAWSTTARRLYYDTEPGLSARRRSAELHRTRLAAGSTA